jgi:F-type H+-transporting ATPase subunit b
MLATRYKPLSGVSANVSIIEQLGLDQTFFAQLAIIIVLFVVLGQVYFKPALKLFEARHKRTVADREAAEKLMAQAEAKLEEYKNRLAEERANARREYETILAEARKEETVLLAHARDEAKKITQQAAENVSAQRAELKRQLETDVESIAHKISERLLARKV